MTLAQKMDMKSFSSGSNSTSISKVLFVVFMLCLQALDMILNSSLNLMICCLASVEYDRYSFLATENDISTLWVVSLGFQLLVQSGVTITLYIMMFDTYPFRVGLMRMVMSRFWGVGLINGMYIISTAVIYGYRVQFLGNSTDEWHIWENTAYWVVSIIQKFGACIFYVSNLWAAFQLRHPIYQDRAYWMKLLYKCGDSGVQVERSGLHLGQQPVAGS